MTGTEKQIAYAQDIINKCIEILNEVLDQYVQARDDQLAKRGTVSKHTARMIPRLKGYMDTINSLRENDALKASVVISEGKRVLYYEETKWFEIAEIWEKICIFSHLKDEAEHF